MTIPKSLTTITPFSKACAFIMFICLPFISFYLGRTYQQAIDVNVYKQNLKPYANKNFTKQATSPLVCPAPPAEYLIRSSCPYTSAAIDNECRVVCPMFRDTGYNVACQKDSDCDCSRYQPANTTKKPECRCAENRCVIAVDKAEVKNWPYSFYD